MKFYLDKFFILLGLFFVFSTRAQPLLNVSGSAGIVYTAGDTQGGSGASFVDFDGDGYDDLTIGTEEGDSIFFFKNNGNSTFTKLPSLVNHTGLSRQIVWVDIDNDNDLDLYVNTGPTSGPSQNRLYEKTASGLQDITLTSGLLLGNFSSYGASFADIDSDGDLDLFVSVLFGHSSIMYRNNGNKTFTDVSVSSGIGNNPLPDFCAAFFDYDNDGDVDLYSINDKYAVANRLFSNNNASPGIFTEVSTTTGADISIDAMNAGIGDYNNDGNFDVFITNTTAGNQLLYNVGGYFFDVANITGVQLPGHICWSAGFFDADNDKDLDLYICNENTYVGGRNFLMKNKFETGDAEFIEYQAGGLVGDTLSSFVMANGDFDQDGKIDVVVVNANNEPIVLWKNNIVNTNNFIKIKLEGTSSNKKGIGSLIKVFDGDSVQHRYTTCGVNFMTQNSFIEHIGMGQNQMVDSIKVKWPSGSTSNFYYLGVNQLYQIKEGGCLLANTPNKYIGTNNNLFLPSNWSKGHLPLISEDVEIINIGTSAMNLVIGSGIDFNCQSLTIVGNVFLTNYGNIKIQRSNGIGLSLGSASTILNQSNINIQKTCGDVMKIKGLLTNNGSIIAAKN
jgi:hypothetical protein